MPLQGRIRQALASPRTPFVAAVVAVVLMLPALGGGAMNDDHTHKLQFDPEVQLDSGMRGDWDLFRFQDRDRANFHRNMDLGLWPWWTSPGFRLAFLRPLASLWHALDYRVYPEAFAWMHAESVLLYGLLVLAAGLVYRRVLGVTATAGLAVLLFAVDDAHAMVVAWIANRHALLSALFGFLAIAAHDRARREGWTPGRVLGPAGFSLSMLAGEGGTSTLAYLFAHAVFLDRGRLGEGGESGDDGPRGEGGQQGRVREVALALAPYAGMTLGWAVLYRLGGYGASGGAFYIDPVGEAGTFVAAVLMRLPVLLAGQIALPPADLWGGLPPGAPWRMTLFTVPIVGLVGAGLALGLRRDRTTAFWATGMVLSLVPACATWPSDRLLLFSGLGAFGLVGALLSGAREGLGRGARWGVRGLAGLFVVIHVVLAVPLLPARTLLTIRIMRVEVDRATESLPAEAMLPESTVVVVNAPDALVTTTALAARFTQMEHGSLPKATRLLAVAVAGTLEVTRPEAQTLSLTASEGMLAEWTSLVFRTAGTPFKVGDRVELPGMTAEVRSLMGDGARPRQVDFTFAQRLDDPSLIWLIWDETRFVRFTLPAVGERRALPAIDYAKAVGLRD
ncbi:hypothetical protein [Chondromyces apiculatus]|uniref:Glycosyltransferase RgtA/B/C/D-like domain-containing protein n=1 Tax=Chondromyces apiculatus DSM 436 TaxID=1192034 RepID=A0A017SZA0_9BACT|nr:hypothetical protein [Chondromyces apiculatus]EYF01935.1 Hypothetical protein CAP_7703 [Chondromyces apiculatus DSM 436]